MYRPIEISIERPSDVDFDATAPEKIDKEVIGRIKEYVQWIYGRCSIKVLTTEDFKDLINIVYKANGELSDYIDYNKLLKDFMKEDNILPIRCDGYTYIVEVIR